MCYFILFIYFLKSTIIRLLLLLLLLLLKELDSIGARAVLKKHQFYFQYKSNRRVGYYSFRVASNCAFIFIYNYY